jgi:6-phosphogluconolactonase
MVLRRSDSPKRGQVLFCLLALVGCSDTSKGAGDASTASGGSGHEQDSGSSVSGAGASGRAGAAGSSGGNGGNGVGAAGGGRGAAAGSGGDAASGGRAAAGSSGAAAASGGAAQAGAGGSSVAVPATETVYVSGNGSDIIVFAMDTKTGALTSKSRVNAGNAPSYLAIAPNKKFLYAVNENNGGASKVIAFSIDGSDGHLTEINSATSGGDGAPHLAVHPSGKWLVVTHYSSGQTSVLPILDTGAVAAATTIDPGPAPGCQKAHQAVFDLTGDYLFVPCLGSNYVIQFKFSAGKLTYNDPASVPVSGGPRHMAIDPQQHNAYVLSELESTITLLKYDAPSGKLSNPQVTNSYQKTKGASAHIVVHASGKWLYASNRQENSLGLFSLDTTGRPNALTFETDMLNTPRDFSVDPLGNFLILANQAGPQNVLVYRIDAGDGRLSRVGLAAAGGSPTFTQAIVLP